MPLKRTKSFRETGPYFYTHALCREMPDSFADALTMVPKKKEKDSICLARAKIEHKNYTEMLQTLVPHVSILPAEQSCPDCCFIEDVLVVVPPFKAPPTDGAAEECLDFPGMAIITRPGAPSRQPEVAPIRDELSTMGWPSKSVQQLQAPATLDGGDVLFTGSELWVGLSHRTNQAALNQLRSLLGPTCPVYAFSMDAAAGGTALHLKSVVTALDETTLLRADNAAGQSVEAQASQMQGLAGRFTFVAVPDPICSNVLRVGKTVVMQKGFPKSEAVIGPLCKARGLSLNALRMGESAKADGALTCCSVLVHLPKQP